MTYPMVYKVINECALPGIGHTDHGDLNQFFIFIRLSGRFDCGTNWGALGLGSAVVYA